MPPSPLAEEALFFPLSPTRERARVRGIDWPCVTPFVTGAW